MRKYDKTVVSKRLRERRLARERKPGQGFEKWLNLFMGIFAVGAVLVLALVVMSLLR